MIHPFPHLTRAASPKGHLLPYLVVMMLSAASPTPAAEVKTLAGPLDGSVGGVTVDALGFLYVADFGEKVWKISPWGDVEVFADSLYGTSGNTIDPQGNLLQSNFNAGTISKIARDGTITTFAEGLSGPVGLALGGDGEVYACNCSSNVISRISPAGEVGDFASGDLFNCPNGITRSSAGLLYVVNFSDGRVVEIDPEGRARHLATLPGGGNGHVVAVGEELYVTAFRANMIFKVAADGTVAPFAGTSAFGQQDGGAARATFSTPNGIAYHPRRDALYVNDYLQSWTERWAGRTRPQSTVREILFPTFEEVARGALDEGGAAAGKRAMGDYVATRPGRPYPNILNLFGYSLLREGDTTSAIAVFELATELFPQLANAWDSLAEGHKVAGRQEKAIEYYRRSLELNPGNSNAVAMLKELGAEP